MSAHIIRDLAALRAVIGAETPGVAAKNQPTLNPTAINFLSRCPFLVLSTADAAGRQDASPKGDAAGFVLVEDNHTIVIPDRPGNKLVYGLANIIENPRVGALCLVPNTRETLRINGTAELSNDPALLEKLAARGKPAIIGIRINVEECFFHCGKAFIRSGLWQPETWPGQDRISFGRLFAEMQGTDAAGAAAIDAMVESDYRNNL